LREKKHKVKKETNVMTASYNMGQIGGQPEQIGGTNAKRKDTDRYNTTGRKPKEKGPKKV